MTLLQTQKVVTGSNLRSSLWRSSIIVLFEPEGWGRL